MQWRDAPNLTIVSAALLLVSYFILLRPRWSPGKGFRRQDNNKQPTLLYLLQTTHQFCHLQRWNEVLSRSHSHLTYWIEGNRLRTSAISMPQFGNLEIITHKKYGSEITIFRRFRALLNSVKNKNNKLIFIPSCHPWIEYVMKLYIYKSGSLSVCTLLGHGH